MTEETKKGAGVVRATYLPAPNIYALHNACQLVHTAFRETSYGVYLVGSCLQGRDYRDVDVRLLMRDEAYDSMFGIPPFQKGDGRMHALWSLMCLTTSEWLAKQSGLPVDFQIQRASTANEKYPNQPRLPLGIFYAPYVSDAAPKAAKEVSADLSEARAIGGRARAESLSPERRSEIAAQAARARWNKEGSE